MTGAAELEVGLVAGEGTAAVTPGVGEESFVLLTGQSKPLPLWNSYSPPLQSI